jgi:hypothetical protein
VGGSQPLLAASLGRAAAHSPGGLPPPARLQVADNKSLKGRGLQAIYAGCIFIACRNGELVHGMQQLCHCHICSLKLCGSYAARTLML